MPKIRKIVDINKKPNDHNQVHWSDKQKYNAVVLYKMTGNMAAVSRSLGIPTNTLFVWRKSKWWPQFEADLLQEKKALTSASLEKLAKKAAEVTADRLDNGDWVFVQGELRRKPVPALTANKILQESIEREIKLEEHYSKQNKAESELQINERLKLLFDEMTRFANSKEIRVATAEGGDPDLLPAPDAGGPEEEEHAIHEERETGLQARTPVGEENHREGSPG